VEGVGKGMVLINLSDLNCGRGVGGDGFNKFKCKLSNNKNVLKYGIKCLLSEH